MENNEVVELLKEIRDLQRLHIESYKEAVRNQQEALEGQRKATRFQRVSLLVLVVFLVAIVATLYLPSLTSH
jgi:hypothetical protein